MSRRQNMIEVTPLSGNLAGLPVQVVIPRAGRVRIDHDAEGVRWLTVRRWWGRTYIHWPLAEAITPCARGCGRTALSEVTWADGLHHGTELLCGPCWDEGAAQARAYALGLPAEPDVTRTEAKPLDFLPDYYPCSVCDAAPSAGVHYWRNLGTFAELHVLELECPAGHRYTITTDGG